MHNFTQWGMNLIPQPQILEKTHGAPGYGDCILISKLEYPDLGIAQSKLDAKLYIISNPMSFVGYLVTL